MCGLEIGQLLDGRPRLGVGRAVLEAALAYSRSGRASASRAAPAR